MRETAQVLEEAAEFIREHGWCQKRSRTPLGEVCMVGSVWGATSTAEMRQGGGWADLTLVGDNSDFYRERRAASEALHAHLESRYGDAGIASWNDRPGRTKDEVIDELLHCAKDLRNAS